MQALVRVQARTRARHARMALENQTAQQKLKEQLEDEAEVKKIEVSYGFYYLWNDFNSFYRCGLSQKIYEHLMLSLI